MKAIRTIALPLPALYALFLAPTLAEPLACQAQPEKKALTIEDYGQWRRIGSVTLSPNGTWMSYSYSPNEGDSSLYIENLDDDTKHEAGIASSLRFSPDSRWAAYLVNPSKKAADKLRKAKKPVVSTLELIDLSGPKPGEATLRVAGASSASFSADSKHLAIKKRRTSSSAKHQGADLLVHDLATGVTRNIGNVDAHAFDKSGELLAYTVDADGMHGNGLYVLDFAAGRQRPLDSSSAKYSRMTWNEAGTSIAVLRGTKPKDQVRRENQVLVFQDLGRARERRTVFDPAKHDTFSSGMVVSELSSLSFHADDNLVSFGIKEQVAEKKPAKDSKKATGSTERANVDVWHYKDTRVQSVQQRRAAGDRRFTYRAVLHLDSLAYVRLATEDMRRVDFSRKARWAIGRVAKPYEHEISWGGRRADYYKVDPANGERALISNALGRSMGSSPDGQWFLYLKAGQVFARNLDTDKKVNLSKASGVDFVNHDDDHPYEKPIYGVAGWSADGAAVVLNHKFDLWVCPLDGSKARNLTRGRGEEDQIRFRYSRLDPEEDGIDLNEPVLLSAYGEWTKKSGYYRLSSGSDPTPLLFTDKSVGRPIKAKNGDRIALTMQTFVESPDYYVTNTSFQNPKRITDGNPHQKEFAWGRRVLVDYKNGRGVRLQATLALPAGYEKGKRYPMLVYFYEKMSQRHHQYSMPRFDDRPHMSTYASNGYLVLMPDVVYVEGRPGDSAVDCVTSAVRAVIELGYADSDRIALQGHSWGGYQSSFILTQTDMFCAVVTGAPVTNLVSFYGELYKSSGTVQQGITEVGQVRMGTTPFENMELFHSQSPLHNVQNIRTPFIILHGTEDGAVDWHQGLEYYNAAKRNGKQAILLSYPGEGHHLSKRANQIDFQIRMKQFFDHYCQGGPMPKWMARGVPFLEKDKADLKETIRRDTIHRDRE